MVSAANAYTSLMPAVARMQSSHPREIKQLKFIGIASTKLRMFQVDSLNPVASRSKKRNKMMTDESTCARYQSPNRGGQRVLPRNSQAK